ncbi:DeoR/GlpR family DNA-binding transcription regulator [Sporolactobacillus sp. THM19-2]|jgi:DeoR/GlpR family transcriptional regulator of sugar metabolism|uniref:DeoR/GlpR family DNA-binding transcription regulator n=1 Tax=Sporolactobacillus sp. THM19-2 TaxID=2511171 RepID=UPI00102284F3|nr:DeoR/GlpR family DNA-binding transcription regulator [Sporolactobacillus sp. THM19-2]RYL94486.1 DeoR/GlpR transcriptional regulator [Sporolactobacillus sp. THM19-2]
MYQEERLVRILEHLKKYRTMSVGDICLKYHVSRDTARRDIIKLVEQKAAIRTHGGIALPEFQETILAYRDRLQQYSAEKIKIGSMALGFLQKNGHYFLNASTTVSCMAKALGTESTIYTHSLDVAQILSNQTKADVFLFGGVLNAANRYFFDLQTLQQLDRIHFDAVFLGTAGITSDGFYYDDRDDAAVNETVSTRAGQTIVLAEDNKFSKHSRFRGMDWEQVDMIITNTKPSSAFILKAGEAGTQIITTGEEINDH